MSQTELYDSPALVSTSRERLSADTHSSVVDLPPRTDVVVVIWGDSFWSFFVDVSLPSQTGPNNVEGYKSLNAYWRFFCRPDEYIRFRDAPSMRRLKELFPVEIVDLSSLERNGEFQYQLMTRCHQQAVYEAEHAIIFISPDVVASGETYRNVAKLAARGARAVLCQGLRITKDSFVPVIHHDRLNLDDLDARKLIEIALAHLHPMTKAFFVRADDATNHSLGSYMWIDHRGGILAHCFHLHPIFIWPNNKAIRLHTTIDHELVRLAVTDYRDIVVVDDSDDVLLCEVSARDHLNDQITFDGFNLMAASGWAKDFAGGLHREFFRIPIYFRRSGRPMSKDVAEVGRRFVNRFLTLLEEDYGDVLGVDMYFSREYYAEYGAYYEPPASAAEGRG